jgi:hypothetical protein
MARPLRKTYSPSQPFEVQRQDRESGSIAYEVWDRRPASYRRLCTIYEEYSINRGQAKKDAELIARTLNAACSPAPAGDGWNTDLSQMPTAGAFDVLRINRDVHRWSLDEVVDPTTGRIFGPTAWRPARISSSTAHPDGEKA